MKRMAKLEHRGETIPTVMLYRDDLDEIVDIMQRHCLSTSISDDKFQYESLDDLQKNKGRQIKSVTFGGSEPYVSLSFASRHPYTFLYASGEEEAEAIFLKLRDLLFKRRRAIARLAPWRFWLLMTVAILFGAGLVPRWIHSPAVLMSVNAIVVLSIAMLVLGVATKMGFLSVLFLDRRHEVDTFWQRNRDKILTSLVTAVAVLLLNNLIWPWAVGALQNNGRDGAKSVNANP